MHPRTILCATDFTPTGEAALREAIGLARRFDARVHVVRVATLQPQATTLDPSHASSAALQLGQRQEVAQADLDRLLGSIDAPDVEIDGEVRVGEAVPGILGAAEDSGADLIVLGTRGRTGLQRFLSANTAEKIVRHADVPVLAVPAPNQ